MAKRQDENPVMYAVQQICDLYGVQYTREQSRVLSVESGGRWRPMYFGTWVDDTGEKHHGGKADFLARPRIKFSSLGLPTHFDIQRIPVPLWIECKAGAGKGNRKTQLQQELFRQWVLKNGDYYMTVQDDARPLIAWFDEHGVSKQCTDADLKTVVEPMDASQLYGLPCRWCSFPRTQHLGSNFTCPMHLRANDSNLIGKVWSPKLRSR